MNAGSHLRCRSAPVDLCNGRVSQARTPGTSLLLAQRQPSDCCCLRELGCFTGIYKEKLAWFRCETIADTTAFLRPACLWLLLAAKQQSCPPADNRFPRSTQKSKVCRLQLALRTLSAALVPTTRVQWCTRHSWPYRQSD